jgi:hypothetical protein
MPAILDPMIAGEINKEEQLYAVKEEHKGIRKKIGQKEGRKQA